MCILFHNNTIGFMPEMNGEFNICMSINYVMNLKAKIM